MIKGNRIKILNIVYIAVAMVLFGVLLVLTFPNRQEKTVRTSYPVVILGDSVLGQCRDETSVAVLLEEKLGKPVFNGAFGGTGMAMQTQGDYNADLLNMVGLSKAIVAEDFGAQQTVRSRRDVTSHFEDLIDELECIDFAQTEVLILAFGVNDYHAGVPLDNAENPKDIYTYGGAMREVLSTLQESYPDMRIVLMTPTYVWYIANDLTCEEYVIEGSVLEDFVEQEMAVAKEYDVEVIDVYHDLYTHEKWDDLEIYTEDGLHPNEYGRGLLADALAEALAEE